MKTKDFIKNIVIFLIFFFTSRMCSAQLPIIDSMLVDEMKSELHIYGSFNILQGKVRVDSVEMPVLSWADSIISVSIPMTGKGSAGAVIVEARGRLSEATMLSVWNVKVDYSFSLYQSCASYKADSAHYDLIFRYDLHSLLKKSPKNHILSFVGVLSSSTLQHTYNLCRRPCCGDTDVVAQGTLRDSSYYYSIQIDLQKRKVTPFLGLEVYPPVPTQPFPNPEYDMDSAYNIVSGSFDTFPHPSEPEYMTWSASKINFPPPSNLLSVEAISTSSPISFSAYPNPSAQELTILYSNPKGESARIFLYDLEGRIIRKRIIYSEVGEVHLQWDMTQIPSGSYVLRLITGNENISQMLKIAH